MVQAQAKFYTVVSQSSVTEGRTFQVRYVIEGAKEVRKFSVPVFREFYLLDDFDSPSTGLNQPLPDAYSKIIVLSPKRTGRFTIPAAFAVIDGKPAYSNLLEVDVQHSPRRLSNVMEDIDTEVESELQPGEDVTKKVNRNLFLRVDASKKNCYVGEPLMVVYKMYSRLNANSQVVKRPSFTGFSVLEMVDSYDSRPELESLNGTLYYTNIIRKVQLFPLQEGNFILDPAEIESDIKFVRVNDVAARRNEIRKAFGDPGAGSPAPPAVFHYKTLLRSEPVTISVKSLPVASQPADFKGAVGQFSLSIRVPPHIRKGDLVKIQVVINGKGNLSLLAPPVIQWPAGVDTADPVVKESFNKYAFPLAGSKTFEYSFAAADTGNLEIPAIQLPYYDPAEKQYKTAATDPLIIHIAPGSSKEGVGKNATGVSDDDTAAVPRQLYWFALVVILIVAWIIYQATFLRKKNMPPVPSEPVVQKPTASELLSRAGVALEQGNQPVFFNEVQNTLWNVVADVCKVLPSALNKQNIAQRLSARGVAPAVILNLLSVLDECEWTLYTPDQSLHDMKQLLNRAGEVLQQLLLVD